MPHDHTPHDHTPHDHSHEETPKYGVMICGHGSRSKSAVAEFAQLAEKLGPKFPDWPVEYGYLEFATPVIKTGLDKLREQGVNHVLCRAGDAFCGRSCQK